MSPWMRVIHDALEYAEREAYQRGLEAARNIAERFSMVPTQSPVMDTHTLEVRKEAAEDICRAINDLMMVNPGPAR